MRLKEQGLSKRAIAKRLGISRDTVSKYWDCVQLDPGHYGPRPQLIDPYRDYITARLQAYPEHHAHVITLRGDSYRVRNRVVPSKFAQAKEE